MTEVNVEQIRQFVAILKISVEFVCINGQNVFLQKDGQILEQLLEKS